MSMDDILAQYRKAMYLAVFAAFLFGAAFGIGTTLYMFNQSVPTPETVEDIRNFIANLLVNPANHGVEI